MSNACIGSCGNVSCIHTTCHSSLPGGNVAIFGSRLGHRDRNPMNAFINRTFLTVGGIAAVAVHFTEEFLGRRRRFVVAATNRRQRKRTSRCGRNRASLIGPPRRTNRCLYNAWFLYHGFRNGQDFYMVDQDTNMFQTVGIVITGVIGVFIALTFLYASFIIPAASKQLEAEARARSE